MFHRKFALGILFLIMNFLVLTGCAYDGGDCNPQETIEYNNEQTLIASEIVDVSEITDSLLMPFSSRYSMSTFIPYQEIQKKNIFGTIRFVDKKYYTVTQLSDGSYFFMLFEEIPIIEEQKALMLVDSFRAFNLADKENFKVNIGDLKSDVLKLDSSSYENDLYSIHRFSDKTVIRINYSVDINGVFIVSDIVDLDTEHSVLTYLLPEDFSLIAS